MKSQLPNRSQTVPCLKTAETLRSGASTITAIRSQIGWLTLLEVIIGEKRARDLFNEAILAADPQAA